MTRLPIDANVMYEPTNLDWGTVCQNLPGVRPLEIALDYMVALK